MSVRSQAHDRLTNEIEKAHLATFGKGDRIVGLTAPDSGAGVSTTAALLAERCRNGGANTLLCDFTQAFNDDDADACWAPGDGSAGQNVVPDPRGFDRLTPRPGRHDRFRFNDAQRLREMFEQDLSRYHAIVLDLSAQVETAKSAIDSRVAANACDSVLLVCKVGDVTRPMLASAAAALAQAEAPLRGLIANDYAAPTLGQEIAREARRFERFAPKLSRMIARRAESARWLAIPA